MLDISNILSDYNSEIDDILEFVNLTGGRNTQVQINDGDGFTTIAVVRGGVSGASINDLIDDGNLIV